VLRQLQLTADRNSINGDGEDLSFITLKIVDSNGLPIAQAVNTISFEISGPGEIVATDNGDPGGMISFASKEREAYSGSALAIVRFQKESRGVLTIKATSPGLKETIITIKRK
jgi:beta-galactosidase